MECHKFMDGFSLNELLASKVETPDTLELSVKSSKESTEPVSLLKTGNKVVEVG
jgi:hypothetical protein